MDDRSPLVITGPYPMNSTSFKYRLSFVGLKWPDEHIRYGRDPLQLKDYAHAEFEGRPVLMQRVAT